MQRIEYDEISRAKVTDTRSVVISNCSKGGYTIAQMMDVKEGDTTTSVFMKGAFHVADISGLYNLRDAINIAIKKIEDASDSDDSSWDSWLKTDKLVNKKFFIQHKNRYWPTWFNMI